VGMGVTDNICGESWMTELAKMLTLTDLPTGVIAGTVVMKEVTRCHSLYE
jgi:hypothetical protein